MEKLNSSQALRKLQEHSCGWTSSNGELHADDSGFIGCLRPFSGLNEKNFHEVVECLLQVAELADQALLDKELVKAIHYLLSEARYLALDPEGLLRRNNLLNNDQILTVSRWVHTIEGIWSKLLWGQSSGLAISPYVNYVASFGSEGITPFLQSILISCLKLDEEDIAILAAHAISEFTSESKPSKQEVQEIVLDKSKDLQEEILRAIYKTK